ncbi:MAG: hypothetical protein AB8B85_06950 [Paracoccaceae bacterium]
MDYEFTTANFVHLATASQVLGFLVTRQTVLRLLVLLGSGFYIVYYYMHLGTPQWDAIVGSSLIALANLVGLLVLIYSRMPIGMRGEDRLLFDAFGSLEPGQFRRLMRVGRLVQTEEAVELTRQGRSPEKLYFVLSGRPSIVKDNHAFRIADRSFVGEVAFKLGTPASASVTLPGGGVYVEWPRDLLENTLNRAPLLKQAFDALISRDMASKVALSAPVLTECAPSPPVSPFGLRAVV